jgi:uncharacterized protein YkwD
MIKLLSVGASLVTIGVLGLASQSTIAQTVRSQPSTRRIAQVAPNPATLEQAVFKQINDYRASQKLPPLVFDNRIATQARSHSQNMANKSVPFGHQGFQQRVQVIGQAIPLRGAAENVAFNMGFRDPATQAVQGWLKSPGHLQNIRGNFDLTGIGVSQNARGEVYFTQIFIKKR